MGVIKDLFLSIVGCICKIWMGNLHLEFNKEYIYSTHFYDVSIMLDTVLKG